MVNLLSSSGHGDSVTCTGFSHDAKYVATADMAGLVQVWACPAGTLVWSFEMGETEVCGWAGYHSELQCVCVCVCVRGSG